MIPHANDSKKEIIEDEEPSYDYENAKSKYQPSFSFSPHRLLTITHTISLAASQSIS